MLGTKFIRAHHFIWNTFNWTPVIINTVFILTVQFAFAHGTVTYPPSRIWNCYQENPENPDSAPCIAAVSSHGTQPLYDWSEINQGFVNGQHMEYVPDGYLASGGRPEKYGGMDQVRSDWVATPVSPGPFTVTWTNSAPHATAYYDVYISNEDWSPDQPLTWNSLTLLARASPSQATATVDIPVTLPFRTGKHVIYSVWQRSDSPEAFYSTSDIDFGNGTTSVEEETLKSPDFSLNQNYPNPCSLRCTIGYRLKKGAFTSLKVYDIYGREVSTLVNSFQASGDYEVLLNSKNLSNGVYFYSLRVGDFIETKRLLLQRE